MKTFRYKYFKYKDKKYTNVNEIEKILSDNNFHWLLNSEFENAEIELINNTIIWKNGTMYYTQTPFIIWEDGTWKDGIFENGIFENGDFENGKFISGIMNGNLHI